MDINLLIVSYTNVWGFNSPDLTNGFLLFTIQTDSQCTSGGTADTSGRRLPISVVETNRSLASIDHICSDKLTAILIIFHLKVDVVNTEKCGMNLLTQQTFPL
jgi:hypothetical protein